MKAANFKLNTVLAGAVGLACLVLVLLRTFAPYLVLPLTDIPNLAAISIIALVVDGYIDGKKLTPHCWALTAVLAVVTFWLLPWAAGITGAVEAVRVGVIGGLLFTALAYLYTAIRERLVTSSAGILAPVCVGFVMYLACQGFMSILL